MRKFLTLIVIFLLSIGLIATLNGGQYVGLTGVLNNLSTIDFSFSDTTQLIVQAFETFEDVGSSGTIWQKVESAVRGVFDMLFVPFSAIRELLELLSNIFDMLFTLVGVF